MREFSQLCHYVAVACTQETLSDRRAAARSSHQPPCPLSVCVCVPGASAAAVQIDFHPGRAGAQRERRSRTVPPSRHVGEPIAAERGRQNSPLSHSRTPELNCPFPLPTEITLYLLLIVLFFFSPPFSSPGFTHYSLGVPSVCLRARACVFVRMCFALNHPCVLFGLAGRTWKRGLAAASRKSSLTRFPTKEKKKRRALAHSFLLFCFSSDLRRPVHLNLPPPLHALPAQDPFVGQAATRWRSSSSSAAQISASTASPYVCLFLHRECFFFFFHSTAFPRPSIHTSHFVKT